MTKYLPLWIMCSYILVKGNFEKDVCNAAGGNICVSKEESEQSRLHNNGQMYSRENNVRHAKFAEMISSAVRDYKLCKGNCSCFTSVIKRDLLPWKDDGITKDMIVSARSAGILYQIINHQLYREHECMFPFRCSGVEHFIHEVIGQLPDMEFVLNTHDWPQVPKNYGLRPVFSFSKTDDYNDILYPAWTFWEGGPAIKLYPTGLGRWDLLRESISKENKKWPWSKKVSKAFFRGSRTSAERDALILLSQSHPEIVEAHYTKNQAWKSALDTLGFAPVEEVPLEHHCQYKYLFNYRGVAASFRFKHLFLCKSVVFHVGDQWQEFFYPALKPWVHYVPVPQDATVTDLMEIILLAQQNDAVMQGIAKRGYDFVWNKLHLNSVRCYWLKLLTQYSQMLQHVPIQDNSLKHIFC